MSGGTLLGGGADPVRELMAEHRELCERAVDPLEIAAGLEEAGLGTDAAARCRHVDLFALAEELYARVPRRPPPPGPVPRRPGGAGAALTVAGSAALPCAGVAAAMLLLARAAPGGDRPVAVALGLAAAVSAGSAEGAARWYRQVGRGHLGAAGTLAGFRARMRPVLPVALALHLAVLGVLSFAALAVLAVVAPRPGPGHGGGLLHLAAERAGPAQWAAQGVLGLLLVLPVLLARCGRSAAAAVGASAGAAAVLGLLALGRSAPEAWLLGGGGVAAALLVYAGAALGRAGSYR
ncbi:hypothetical protein [Kitasatospora brasiliensis]|uniref:hypothetical protein n=1 Tax=Kitasatospora brasiliensis TaxID=3058040 RepID=UPI00292E1B7E|nr:hypothetical protein [Kitasatospora sp. K002]